MKRNIEMYGGDMVATFDDTQELRNEVFESIVRWIGRHNASSGESMQNDDFVLEAPELLCDIIDDLFQFKTEWKDSNEDI
jgi:hypothetical protein